MIYPFGLAVAAALCAGVLWSLKQAADDREKKTLEIFWLLALPLGLALAHVFYVLSNLDMLEDYLGEALADFAGGGYLLYGALAGAAAALGIACRISGGEYGKTADRLAGPFLLFGAACALAEGLIGGGTGWKVEDWFQAEGGMSLFALEEPGLFGGFPFALQDPVYGGSSWAVFLPVALILLAGLWRLCRMPAGWLGNRAVFSLSFYGAVRILYESLRQDDIPKWGFVRVNQILSAVLLLSLLLLCAWKAGQWCRKQMWISLAVFSGGVILAGAMEFALEDKILEWMTMDLCYVCSAAGCWLLYLAVSRLRKLVPARGAAGEEKEPAEGRKA